MSEFIAKKRDMFLVQACPSPYTIRQRQSYRIFPPPLCPGLPTSAPRLHESEPVWPPFRVVQIMCLSGLFLICSLLPPQATAQRMFAPPNAETETRQMALDTKRAEIRKLEEQASQREEALKKSEALLEEDGVR